MNEEMKWMVNMLVDEMGRIEERITRRFDGVDQRLDAMQHEISFCKLEGDSVGLLIKKIDQLESRVEELEERTA